MARTIFYAWQADRPNGLCRGFIEKCLKKAIQSANAALGTDSTLDLDRDTQKVPGSPVIAETILSKINGCSIFVADLTAVARYRAEDGRVKRSPNPNVLLEYGYALKAKGYTALIGVCNTHFGGRDSLPFDLKHRRAIIEYSLTARHSAAERSQIAKRFTQDLTRAILDILKAIVPGALDQNFGTGGIAIVRQLSLIAKRFNSTPDGLVVSGWHGGKLFIAKFNDDGSRRSTFGENGVITSDAAHAADLNDVRYIGGYLFALPVVNNDGLLFIDERDPTRKQKLFPGSDINYLVYDGEASELLSTGGTSKIAYIDRGKLTAGLPDAASLISLKLSSRLDYARATATGGRLYLFGRAGDRGFGVERYLMNGAVDKSFGDNGCVHLNREYFFNQCNALLVDSEGLIWLTGHGNNSPVVCLRDDGTPNPKFGDNGYIHFRGAHRGWGMKLIETKRGIVICGGQSNGTGITNCFAGRFFRNGSVDEEFGTEGYVTIATDRPDEFVDAFVEHDKLTILFKHDVEHTNFRRRFGFARVQL